MALAKKTSFDAYKDTEISTADQGKLIIMLYEGAIRFLRIAAENMSPRTYDVVNNNIIKSQDIITELMLSLNMEAGGEIAENLFNLYAYMKKRLLEGNMNKDAAILKEVIKMLENLKTAWDDASLKADPSTQKVPENRARGISFSVSG